MQQGLQHHQVGATTASERKRLSEHRIRLVVRRLQEVGGNRWWSGGYRWSVGIGGSQEATGGWWEKVVVRTEILVFRREEVGVQAGGGWCSGGKRLVFMLVRREEGGWSGGMKRVRREEGGWCSGGFGGQDRLNTKPANS